MTKKYCDRCGKEVPSIVFLEIPNNKWKKSKRQISNPISLPCSFEFNGRTFDFCGSCVDDFKSFLREKHYD